MIKNYNSFKNMILENKEELDNPFLSIDKSIKGLSITIQNMLTLDGELKEVNGIYYMISKDDNDVKIIKKIIITKIERSRVYFKVLNDSNIGKYKPEDEKEQVIGLSKLLIYKHLDKLSDVLKKSGDDIKIDNKIKNKLNQTKYIEQQKQNQNQQTLVEETPIVNTTTGDQINYNYTK